MKLLLEFGLFTIVRYKRYVHRSIRFWEDSVKRLYPVRVHIRPSGGRTLRKVKSTCQEKRCSSKCETVIWIRGRNAGWNVLPSRCSLDRPPNPKEPRIWSGYVINDVDQITCMIISEDGGICVKQMQYYCQYIWVRKNEMFKHLCKFDLEH